MEIVKELFEIFIHLDKHLGELIQNYGMWTYLLLFFVIYAETGFVVTPFLPGDSLLFAVGAFAARGSFDIVLIYPILCCASILGDTTNYWIGHFVGPKVFQKENVKFFKKEYLERTHQFYEKHGAKTIIIGKFIPIIRTFAPFVAGIGRMTYIKFVLVNISAAIIWISCFMLGGYFFGNLPFARNNFSFVIVAIILISMMPGIIEFVRHRINSSKQLEK